MKLRYVLMALVVAVSVTAAIAWRSG